MLKNGTGRLIAGAPPGQQLEFAGLPGKFVVGGGRAFLSTIETRASTFFRVRLIAPGQTDGNVAGPHLTAAARRGLAFIMAWGGLAFKTVIGDQDEDEPYNYLAGASSGEGGIWTRALINHGVFRRGGMDLVVVWNAPGAGDTGFLADFFHHPRRRGGALRRHAGSVLHL